ncbi:hypothetical protein GCM10027597_27700 [Saccharopolyspora tripterygii]
MNQLAEATGEPASSLYRLLSSLEALGWVEPGSKRGRTRLGPAMVRLGYSIEADLNVRDAARGELRRIQQATGQTALLCVRDAGRAVCMERVEGSHIRIGRLKLGDSVAPTESIVGRAIFAFEPRLVADQPAELRAMLERVAEAGFAVERDDLEPGVGGVAVPVFDYRRCVVGSISVLGLAEELFEGAFDAVDIVQRAARTVSTGLGMGVLEAANGKADRGHDPAVSQAGDN